MPSEPFFYRVKQLTILESSPCNGIDRVLQFSQRVNRIMRRDADATAPIEAKSTDAD
jgi:hypothetical protein